MPKKLKCAKFDVSMKVDLLAGMSKSDAYWCAPAVRGGKLQTYLWSDRLGFVLPKQLTIILDYPLNVEARKSIEVDTGTISVGEILWEAAQFYGEIYRAEDETSATKAGFIPGMHNRNKTDGKYGIWGHVIGDLVFEGMTLSENGEIKFQVGS